jgi:shikimate kinase
MAHFRAREDRLTFQMTAAQAAAAIATGGFAVAPDSKSEAEEETVTLMR